MIFIMANLKIIFGILLVGLMIFSACDIVYPDCLNHEDCIVGEYCEDTQCVDCPEYDCAQPPDNCHYEPTTEANGCKNTCGDLICDGVINKAPLVNAGKDFSVEVNKESQLAGSVTDDGLPINELTKTWSLISGPGDVIFEDASWVDTSVFFKNTGTYVLRLTGYDSELSASDDIKVTVYSGGSNAFSVDTWIEAEEGDLIAPMKKSSDGKYIYSDTENSGYAKYAFEVTKEGEYILETYVQAGGDNADSSDSFFVGLKSDNAQNNNFKAWDIQKSTSFVQDSVSWRNADDWQDTSKRIDPAKWKLTPGTYDFYFYGRESNTRLDKVKLSTKSIVKDPTCNDGIKNQNEVGVDCGGVCPICPDGETLYEPYEVTLTHSGTYSNPYYYVNSADAIITTPSGAKKTVPMFWDGGKTWKFRYSPMQEGTHIYKTTSTDAGLNGKTGSFNAVDMGNKGFLEIDSNNPRYFKYSEENEPVFMMGDTFWNSFSTAGNLDFETFKDYVDIRADQGFNFLRMYTVPFYYEPNANKPELNEQHWNEGGLAFLEWDHDKLNPGYFQGVEKRIAYANSKGLMVHLVVGSDKNLPTRFFGWADDGLKMERYIKHLAARLDAYNINWEGRTEFEEQDNARTSGEPTAMVLANKIGNWIEKYGVHNHLQSMHTLDSSEELAGEEWFDWIMHQGNPGSKSTALNDGRIYAWDRVVSERSHGKPIMNEEFYYELVGEPDIWGHHVDADKVRKGAWQLLIRGVPGFAFGNSATYNARGGPFKDIQYATSSGADYMTNTKKFFSHIDFWDMEPKANVCSTGYCLVNPNKEYVAYSESGSSFTVNLGSGTYEAKFYNPRTGTFNSATTVAGCQKKSFTKPDSKDWVLYLKATSNTPSCSSGGERIVLQDDLQGKTIGTQVDGKFTSEGYNPGRGYNHILYDVPEQIWNGYVEVEVKGFNFDDFPTDESNSNSFYVFYDGRGISEPIQYWMDYRNNYYRWETVYRSNKPGTCTTCGNRFKGKILLASQETSEALVSGQKAVFANDAKNLALADWKNEPNGITKEWDPNKWYTIKTSWNNDDMDFQIFRDNEEVWNIKKEAGKSFSGSEEHPSTSPYPWYPKDFKIWLGAGPGKTGQSHYSNEMPNLVFRNFKVVSVE